ncbi:polymer-forming cytoskeletal protein, partial [Streptococcus anginosus]|nr:polymer-forming cytoskeletal protein [Streptococcus anginosus]
AEVCGDARVKSLKDYIVFKNNWSSGRYFTYTKSNKMWKAGCFYGTGQELINKAYKDSENSGKRYEAYVKFVEMLEELENE